MCELLLAEKEAYLANGLTQKGWDIAVLDGEKTIRVQVKCINWNSSGQAAVKGTFISQEFDYLVLILLHFNNQKFTSYVIPYGKLKEKGENVNLGKLCEEIKLRDREDSTREHSPLKKADDAIYIDTTGMSINEVLKMILGYIKTKARDL